MALYTGATDFHVTRLIILTLILSRLLFCTVCPRFGDFLVAGYVGH